MKMRELSKKKMVESLPVQTRQCEPVFPSSSLLSTAINPGNGAREDQRRTLNGDKRKVYWLGTLRLEQKKKQRQGVLHPHPSLTQKSYPDLAFLSPYPSSRWQFRQVHSSPRSNGSPVPLARETDHEPHQNRHSLSSPGFSFSFPTKRYMDRWSQQERHSYSSWPDLESFFVFLSSPGDLRRVVKK